MLNLDELRLFSSSRTSLAVVGYPIKHSLSPVFQNAALQAMSQVNSRLNDWEYLKIEAPVEALGEVIDLCRNKGFRGLNLTIPHKVEVLKYLDLIDPMAEKMGAVNTLIFDENGVTGHNTDGYGISNGVESALGIKITGRSVVMLGAGGAARAAAVQCLQEGCAELWIGNRSKNRLKGLLDQLHGDFPGISVNGFELGVDSPVFSNETLLINATSLGLNPEDPMPIASELLESVGYVYDMVYGKEKTALFRTAEFFGIPVSNGLPMLVFQGEKSLSLWTGIQPPVDVMLDAVKHVVEN